MSLSVCCATKLTEAKFSDAEDRKRKLSQEAVLSSAATPSQKRLRTLPPRPLIEDILGENTVATAVDVTGREISPIEYWRKEFCWPKEYFQPECNMSHLLALARKKSTSSLRGKQSETGSSTPSDQKPRDVKSTVYARPSYTTVLATKGSFMDKSDLGITDTSKNICRILLEKDQTVPRDSLFRDDIFEKTCRKIQDRNEAKVVQDITRLIVPSAEILATYGAEHLDVLFESVNEGWNSSISLYGPRPQPDYSVGFGRSAFSDEQLDKLTPFVGEVTDTFTSYFMATWQIYLPFLTCEVKCGTAALDVADRQNAHSMTLAVRGVVELFKLVKRENEIHREIVGFSVSHDHRTVRIYGHYPVIDDKKTTFYRHPIREFSFTELDGKEKWTAYKFTKNLYDVWMPTHLKRIQSAIDELPQLDFEALHPSGTGGSGLSDKSSHNAASIEETGSQASHDSTRDATPRTSVTERIEGRASKKPRRGPPTEPHQSQENV